MARPSSATGTAPAARGRAAVAGSGAAPVGSGAAPVGSGAAPVGSGAAPVERVVDQVQGHGGADRVAAQGCLELGAGRRVGHPHARAGPAQPGDLAQLAHHQGQPADPGGGAELAVRRARVDVGPGVGHGATLPRSDGSCVARASRGR